LILLHDGAIGMIGQTDSVVKAYIEDCEQRYSRIETADVEDPIYDEVLTCCVDRLGTVTIHEVAFFGADGKQTTVVDSGTGLTMRVRFEAHEPIDNPCIRVQFLRNDGLLATGSNTYRHDLKLGELHGVYEAVCHFPHFNLLEGDYYANIGVWPDEFQSFVAKTPFDIHEYNDIIAVRSHRIDGGGLARVPCAWDVKKLEDEP